MLIPSCWMALIQFPCDYYRWSTVGWYQFGRRWTRGEGADGGTKAVLEDSECSLWACVTEVLRPSSETDRAERRSGARETDTICKLFSIWSHAFKKKLLFSCPSLSLCIFRQCSRWIIYFKGFLQFTVAYRTRSKVDLGPLFTKLTQTSKSQSRIVFHFVECWLFSNFIAREGSL